MDDHDELPDADPLDDGELALVEQDLADLSDFRATFEPEGFHGVSIWCEDCGVDHYYGWDILEANLNSLIETGETPVHEPAYQPEASRYIGWDYARGYVDALRDLGVTERRDVEGCGRCGLSLDPSLTQGNFCPRCGAPLLVERLRTALQVRLGTDEAEHVLREIGLPAPGTQLD